MSHAGPTAWTGLPTANPTMFGVESWLELRWPCSCCCSWFPAAPAWVSGGITASRSGRITCDRRQPASTDLDRLGRPENQLCPGLRPGLVDRLSRPDAQRADRSGLPAEPRSAGRRYAHSRSAGQAECRRRQLVSADANRDRLVCACATQQESQHLPRVARGGRDQCEHRGLQCFLGGGFLGSLSSHDPIFERNAGCPVRSLRRHAGHVALRSGDNLRADPHLPAASDLCAGKRGNPSRLAGDCGRPLQQGDVE